MSIIGTPEALTIQACYRGSQSHVEGATFAPPAPGQTTLPDNYAATLEPIITANCH